MVQTVRARQQRFQKGRRVHRACARQPQAVLPQPHPVGTPAVSAQKPAVCLQGVGIVRFQQQPGGAGHMPTDQRMTGCVEKGRGREVRQHSVSKVQARCHDGGGQTVTIQPVPVWAVRRSGRDHRHIPAAPDQGMGQAGGGNARADNTDRSFCRCRPLRPWRRGAGV